MMSLHKYCIDFLNRPSGDVLNFDSVRLNGRCSSYPPLRYYRRKKLAPLEILELHHHHHVEPCFELRYKSLCRYFDNVFSKDDSLNNNIQPGFQFSLNFD